MGEFIDVIVSAHISNDQKLGYAILDYLFGENLGYTQHSLDYLNDKYKFSNGLLEIARKFVKDFDKGKGYGVAIRYLSHQMANREEPETIMKLFEIEEKYKKRIPFFKDRLKNDKCPHCDSTDYYLSSIGAKRVMLKCSSCDSLFMSRCESVEPWKKQAKQLYLGGMTHKEVAEELNISYAVVSNWGRNEQYSRPISFHQRTGRKKVAH